MLRYIFKRAISLIISLCLASIIIFAVVEIAPGDPASFMLGINAQEDTIAALRAELGLDQDKLSRYFTWVTGMIQGDFGTSIWTGRPVISEIYINAWPTIELTALSVILGAGLSIPIGCFMAISRGSFSEVLTRVIAIAGLTIPSFWLGIVSIFVVAKLFPSFIALGYVPFTEDPIENLKRRLRA